MKWSLRDRLGTGLLVLGFALALPAYAQMGGGMGPGAQQMSGTMHEVFGQMDEMMKPSTGGSKK